VGAYLHIWEFDGSSWGSETLVQLSPAPNGGRVDLDGDTIVVGSDGSEKAWIVRKHLGVWAQEQVLVASDSQPDDRFGTDVAVEGDTIAVGASRRAGPDSLDGAAYVFTRTGAGAEPWEQRTIITNPENAPGSSEQFGLDLDLSGGTLVVGAPYDTLAGDGGATFIFDGAGDAWNHSQTLRSPTPDSIEEGLAVAIDGDALVIGERNAAGVGAVDTWVRLAGVWTHLDKYTAVDGASNDRLGALQGLALSGGRVAAGAFLDDNSNGHEAGAVYAFNIEFPAGEKLISPETDDREFGHSIAIDGDWAVVGAPGDTVTPTAGQANSTYVLKRNSAEGAWSVYQELVSSTQDALPVNYYGRFAAID
jgi:hypothetical protein